MKAIVQTGPREIAVEERAVPEPGPDEALVAVHTAGVCGSDAHAYTYEGGYEWIQLPRVMGHEYAGEVVEVGADVTDFAPGDEVVEEPIHDCGECFQCKNGQPNVCQNFSITGMHRDGAYSEYVAVAAEHLHRVPEGLSLGAAAVTEPLSVATRAVLDQSVTDPGDDVLVFGPGPIGVLVATVADSLGANVLVAGLEKDAEHRFPVLDDLGVATVDVQSADLAARTEAFTDGKSFDVVFDTTGHHTGVENAVDAVRKGGQIVVVGLPGEPSELFLTPLVRGEVALDTSYGSTWRNFEQALRLLENGTVDPDPIVDTSYSVDDPERAFEDFLDSATVKPAFRFGGA
jgi:L-iditol 2-dehydrogenase